MYPSSTPGKIPYFGWKVEVKSFPTVYDTPMLFNIGMSYTVGKLLKSTFQFSVVRNCVFEYLLPASLIKGHKIETSCNASCLSVIDIVCSRLLTVIMQNTKYFRSSVHFYFFNIILTHVLSPDRVSTESTAHVRTEKWSTVVEQSIITTLAVT